MTSDGSARPVPSGEDGPTFEVLVVALDAVHALGMQVAVAASAVREVARIDRVTAYPGAPRDVPGVAAVRGRIVPVLDLSPTGPDARPVVLLAVGTRALALARGVALRVVVATHLGGEAGGEHAAPRLWSGRPLPLAGVVRLDDAARPDAADGAVLPLLDAAALIDDVVDDSDGEQ